MSGAVLKKDIYEKQLFIQSMKLIAEQIHDNACNIKKCPLRNVYCAFMLIDQYTLLSHLLCFIYQLSQMFEYGLRCR